ncbi:transcriptional regulator, GntR family [Novosphingobium aromaticivorans DSM 12444]|uniref:Transcriptional regulator, GntR family n=2 Tax=Novosphingobium aromaticivorans TaxID=48935 RepID=Q2GC10_NOVAD|nr:transcriptional regulator, GntR family [Novosphingobium aromaticivorans DSM 12444]SCY22852.1 transcriptional regulator, GntR family [Novosphingobium aromaticivorans]
MGAPLYRGLYYGNIAPMSSSSRPVYLRLRDEIAAGIIDGRYPEGAVLPSVRAFATEQGANPLTVAKAYQQFQDEGLVTVQRGIGMFVAPGAATALLARERQTFLRDEWPEIAGRIRRLGLSLADLAELA